MLVGSLFGAKMSSATGVGVTMVGADSQWSSRAMGADACPSHANEPPSNATREERPFGGALIPQQLLFLASCNVCRGVSRMIS